MYYEYIFIKMTVILSLLDRALLQHIYTSDTDYSPFYAKCDRGVGSTY